MRFDELPWVQATQADTSGGVVPKAGALARRMAQLALELFPGTILPNTRLSHANVGGGA